MFADSPGLHGVEHPIYDVWLVDCKGGTTVIQARRPPADTAATDTDNPDAATDANAPASPQIEPAPAPAEEEAEAEGADGGRRPPPRPRGDNAPLDLGGGATTSSGRTR